MDARVRFRGDEAVKGKRFMYYSIGLVLLIVVGTPLLLFAGCVGLIVYNRHVTKQESIAAVRAQADAEERYRTAQSEAQAKAAAEERRQDELQLQQQQAEVMRQQAEAKRQQAEAEAQRAREHVAEEDRRRVEAEAVKQRIQDEKERAEREQRAAIVRTKSDLADARNQVANAEAALKNILAEIELIQEAKISLKPATAIQVPLDKLTRDANGKAVTYRYYLEAQKDDRLTGLAKKKPDAEAHLADRKGNVTNLEAELRRLEAGGRPGR
ncbi:MAG TPA: hypothetical protein VFG68_22700 [Fimbriiglobus sp.]|nr:hypothetical protein [Fimbriiglobus sp.]